MPSIQWGKKNPTMTQTGFAAGKNTVWQKIYAKESLVSKKEKKSSFTCTEQQEDFIEKLPFLSCYHLSSNSTRRGNLNLVLAKDHFSTEMRTQH